MLGSSIAWIYFLLEPKILLIPTKTIENLKNLSQLQQKLVDEQVMRVSPSMSKNKGYNIMIDGQNFFIQPVKII